MKDGLKLEVHIARKPGIGLKGQAGGCNRHGRPLSGRQRARRSRRPAVKGRSSSTSSAAEPPGAALVALPAAASVDTIAAALSAAQLGPSSPAAVAAAAPAPRAEESADDAVAAAVAAVPLMAAVDDVALLLTCPVHTQYRVLSSPLVQTGAQLHSFNGFLAIICWVTHAYM